MYINMLFIYIFLLFFTVSIVLLLTPHWAALPFFYFYFLTVFRVCFDYEMMTFKIDLFYLQADSTYKPVLQLTI